MLRIFDTLTGHRRLVLTENDRAILTRKGRIIDLLGAGEHRIKGNDTVDRHTLTSGFFMGKNVETFLRDAPELATKHLVEIRTGAADVAVVARDGRLISVVAPASGWGCERTARSHESERKPRPTVLRRRLSGPVHGARNERPSLRKGGDEFVRAELFPNGT